MFEQRGLQGVDGLRGPRDDIGGAIEEVDFYRFLWLTKRLTRPRVADLLCSFVGCRVGNPLFCEQSVSLRGTL